MKASVHSLAAFFLDELAGWKRWEIVWFCVSIATVLALSLYWHDTLMGIISACTGIAYTLCNGKGKRIAYVFGAINALLYAIISFGAGYYGEVMLNGIYYFPMMFVGFYAWSKNIDTTTHEVVKLKMSARGRVLLLVVLVAGIIGYGLILRALGGSLPFVDSASTVISVVALVVAIKRYMEQWAMWTIVNIITVVMWAIAFAQGAESIATLAMWVVYLLTGVFMWIKWSREVSATHVSRRTLTSHLQ